MIDLLMLASSVDDSTPSTFVDAIQRWANIESPAEQALLVFGLFAQALFFMRWVVQWIATERRKDSHIPVLFWWISLAGASMMFLYFALRGDIVGILGQSVGWTVYLRNLMLIRRKARGPTDDAETD